MVRSAIVTLFLLLTIPVSSQKLIQRLQAHGFENLRLFKKSGELYLGYENNRYRFEGDALVEIINELSKEQVTGLSTHVLVYNTGLPVVYVRIPNNLLLHIKSNTF